MANCQLAHRTNWVHAGPQRKSNHTDLWGTQRTGGHSLEHWTPATSWRSNGRGVCLFVIANFWCDSSERTASQGQTGGQVGQPPVLCFCYPVLCRSSLGCFQPQVLRVGRTARRAQQHRVRRGAFKILH